MAITGCAVSFRKLSQGLHSLWKFRKNGICFSVPCKSENWAGSVIVCEFCGLQSAREKLPAYQSETALPKNKRLLKKRYLKNCRAKSQRMHFLSVLTDRVHQPLATVRVAHTFVLLFCPVWQRFAKCLWILNGFFCTNPVSANRRFFFGA